MFQNNVFWHSQYRPDEKKIIIIVVNLARSMMMIKENGIKEKKDQKILQNDNVITIIIT